MDTRRLTDDLVVEARHLGFSGAAVTGVERFDEARNRALDAVAQGRMDGMPWFTNERVVAATDLGGRYPWARSLISLAWPYAPAATPGVIPTTPPAEPGRPRGRMAAYACLPGGAGTPVDYHSLLAERCDRLADWLAERAPGLRSKRFVDHGWAMDRAVAERAGLGFAGKHASLLTTEAGSYVMLAELLVSVQLPPGRPSTRNCGSCRACLPACPTGAITAPGVIDARRCISYLTIEHRGSIPTELRELIGTWVFGCDLCQEACPINARLAPPAMAPGPPGTAAGPVPYPDLLELLELDEPAFAARFAGSAVGRTGRARIARNAAIALGNSGDRAALSSLRRAAERDPDPVVREAAGWALRRLSGASSSRDDRGGIAAAADPKGRDPRQGAVTPSPWAGGDSPLQR